MVLRHGLCRLRIGSCTSQSSIGSITAGQRCTRSKIIPIHIQIRTSTVSAVPAFEPSRIRNIGIIAHIDAGKTTTTERMLYYSGYTKRLGDVDDGSTVTDFLPAERARGITIQSAAVTFDWPPVSTTSNGKENDATQPRSSIVHHINLIDTPGHADFTFEVRRSLRVLDGAVCILDGVAGVEAQTEQVWKQADEWSIPRIAYINKLDRNGATFNRTVMEIGTKLGGWPALCQIPWWKDGKGAFCGVGDVVHLRALRYEEGGDGKSIQVMDLNQLTEIQPNFAEEIKQARLALVELLSEHDDDLVEAFLEAEEDHLAINPRHIWDCLRRVLLRNDGKLIPVFAGSSFRNIGVQPLLDAINNLLPSPGERPAVDASIGSQRYGLDDVVSGQRDLISEFASATSNKRMPSPKLTGPSSVLKGCALAFKVVNDPRRGALVYFRVYSGKIDRNDLLFNTNLHVSERATTLLRMYAAESIPVGSVSAGEIGVIAGSKHARTGDTLVVLSSNKPVPPKPLDQLQLRPIRVPPPVFFASIEPNSLRDEKDMHEKLALLLREDPSLHVSQDHDTGQTLISGMGELHLEIAYDRLVGDLRANARMGKIEIGYRESIAQPTTSVTRISDRGKSELKGKAGCTAMIQPSDHPYSEFVNEAAFLHEQDGNSVVILTPTLSADAQPISDNNHVLPDHLNLRDIQLSFINGALAALSRGPAHSYPVHGVRVILTFEPHEHIFGSDTTYAALTSAARLATRDALNEAIKSHSLVLMEPVMDVDISVDESSLGTVVQDLSSNRGGHVISLGDDTEKASFTEQGREGIDAGKIYAPPDPFASEHTSGPTHQTYLTRMIKAKVPLKEMVGYLKHLRSMTGGRGTFVMSIDRFERMSGQREKTLLGELRGAA